MDKALQMLNNVTPYIIIFLAIALCSALLAAAFYVWTFLHKRLNLKEINKSKEENRQILEEANMLKFSTRFGEEVEKSLKELNELREKVKNAKAELADLETETKAKARKNK